MKKNMIISIIVFFVLCFGTQSWADWQEQRPIYSLTGVWGSSANDVFVVGDRILHYDGTAWTEMASPASDWLNGVWGSSANDVFAVSRHGLIRLDRNGKPCLRWAQWNMGKFCK